MTAERRGGDGMKPCPYCNGPAEVFRHPPMFYVSCVKTTETPFPRCGPDKLTRREAILAWNKREGITS